eukprot:14834_5
MYVCIYVYTVGRRVWHRCILASIQRHAPIPIARVTSPIFHLYFPPLSSGDNSGSVNKRQAHNRPNSMPQHSNTLV